MTSAWLAVGIGNTTVKLGRSASHRPQPWPAWQAQKEVPTANFDASTLAEVLPETPVDWYVASVQRTIETSLRAWVRTNRPLDRYRALTAVDLPLDIQVEAPQRVGLDRLTAAVAANQLRSPDHPAVVVDAGTALTVNLVSADGAFQGGVILPGFSLTARALSGGTDLLPLVTADFQAEPPPVVGKSTEAAIRSGLFWGNVGAVREIIARMEQSLPVSPEVFVTGGDARRLAGFVAPSAKFIPDLVLAGILFSVPDGDVS